MKTTVFSINPTWLFGFWHVGFHVGLVNAFLRERLISLANLHNCMSGFVSGLWPISPKPDIAPPLYRGRACRAVLGCGDNQKFVARRLDLFMSIYSLAPKRLRVLSQKKIMRGTGAARSVPTYSKNGICIFSAKIFRLKNGRA